MRIIVKLVLLLVTSREANWKQLKEIATYSDLFLFLDKRKENLQKGVISCSVNPKTRRHELNSFSI